MMNPAHPREEFLLKWNDHHNSFFSIMQDLCAEETLTDVTLACGGQVFETHKIMLCVCSTFFRSILTKRPDRHPIVFLKDVNPQHLEQLLQYMYQGEINVWQEDLAPLIETARALQVKGLSDAPGGGAPRQGAPSRAAPSPPAAPPPLKKARNPLLDPFKGHKSSSAPTSSHLAQRLSLPVKLPSLAPPTPSFPLLPNEPEPLEGLRRWDRTDAQGKSDVAQDADARSADPDGSHDEDEWAEPEVHDGSRSSGGGGLANGGANVRWQSRTTTTTPPPPPVHGLLTEKIRRHECTYCGKRFPTPSKLQRHALIHTGEKPYVCVLCQKGFTQLTHLKNHLKYSHKSQTCNVGDSSTTPSAASPTPTVATPTTTCNPHSPATEEVSAPVESFSGALVPKVEMIAE